MVKLQHIRTLNKKLIETFISKPPAFSFGLSAFRFPLLAFRFRLSTFCLPLLALGFFLSAFSFQLSAQQDPQFNQYFFNPVSINPAYAGSRGTLSAVAVHRSQWVGFDGAPTTQAFAIHSPTRRKKMGLGLQVMNDQIGPKNTVSLSGIYAYKIRFLKGKLAFGLRASYFFYSFNWDEIKFDESGGTVSANAGIETYGTPSFDFGTYYSDDKNYAGVEFTHLNEGKIGIQSQNVNIESTSRQVAQMIVTAGRAFVLNRFVTLKPSILVKTSGNQPAFIDVNGSVLLKEKLWLGLSYRRGYGTAAIFEYYFSKQFRIGYSYDIAVTDVNRSNSGSHEIMIGYDFNLFKSRFTSPRYF